GLFDAEDLYGPFRTYKAIEKNSDNFNMLVFGPWSHGDWAGNSARQVIGNIHFGDDISATYQKDYESVFFNHFLKSESKGMDLAEAHVFNTGAKEWNDFEVWPPKNVIKKSFYLGDNQNLTSKKNKKTKTSFVSDPQKPVPYTEDVKFGFTPRKFMTDDQRFAARRPDVLMFETEVFTEDFSVLGEVLADLQVATTGSAADWIVKIIDVFPADTETTDDVQDHLKLSNYHMMVRSEVFRGRYRDGFDKPKAFKPNTKENVKITLQDINHTFKKGHKLQVQVQSTFFPYIDINPQTYVDNIFKAKKEDFQKQTHTIFGDSRIIFDFAE
ncbi:MAG: CocE/NonD family hydrolase, partial [Psychroflexus sp.]